MTKKKLLFVQESLTLAGGEKSLIALLSNLDPEKYEIDLQLFKFGGALDAFIPDNVRVLPPLAYTKYVSGGWRKHSWEALKGKNTAFFKSKLTYSLKLRKRKFNHPEKAQIYWESIGKVIEENPKEYDVAIAYAQGIPTFYTLEKTKAKKKIAWVNVKLKFPTENKKFQYQFYKQFNHVVTVSDMTKKQFEELYPDLKDKVYTVYDIIDYKSMTKMAELVQPQFDYKKFNILTVARLNLNQKGYDITLKACKLLKERGVDFHWYAIGKGEYRETMEKYIIENELEEYFTLLGTTANPYPYFKAADLYVQTSRHEGYGLSIAEARLLNTPVVTTRYDSVDVQMTHEKNGLITDLNAEAVAEGIIRMMEDKALYLSIVEYLKKEPKENLESVERFDRMMEE